MNLATVGTTPCLVGDLENHLPYSFGLPGKTMSPVCGHSAAHGLLPELGVLNKFVNERLQNGKATREAELVVEVAGYMTRLFGCARALKFGPLALKAEPAMMIEAGLSRSVVDKHLQRLGRVFKREHEAPRRLLRNAAATDRKDAR